MKEHIDNFCRWYVAAWLLPVSILYFAFKADEPEEDYMWVANE